MFVIHLEYKIAKRKRRRNARLEKEKKVPLESLCKRGRGWSFSHSMFLNA
jgi:hypothetical protein